MKTPQLLTLGSLVAALVSCGSFKNFNQPLSGSGDFDPLSSPGSTSGGGSALVAPTSPSYNRGQWVETSMPNATFFRNIPRGGGSADRVLAAGTPMKVVSSKGTYVKVELDSGEVGYVPEIMVIDRKKLGTPASGGDLDFGPVPPPVEPGVPGSGIAPPPEIPGTPPPVPEVAPVPEVPSLPDVPSIPDVPAVPEPVTPGEAPTVPDTAPPPTVPGITD